MENSKTFRLTWVDIARGIAIILMIIGHATIPQSLSKYIWSFHMPLFFVVSGMLYAPRKYISFVYLLKRRFYTLFIPYWFFTLIVFFGYTGAVYQNVHELWNGWTGYALWFIPVLFVGELCLYWVIKLQRRWSLLLTAVLSASVGYVLSICEITLPFKVNVVPFALFFLIVGFAMRDWLITIKPQWYVVVSSGIFTIALSQFLPKLDMCVNNFGWMVPNLLNAFLGVFFIFSFSQVLERMLGGVIKPVTWAGRNSLFIMAFSQLFNYWLVTILVFFPHIVEVPLRYILLLIGIYLAANGLRKYTPMLVGADVLFLQK